MSGSFPGCCPGIVSGQMDGTGETGRNLPEAAQGSLDLDALAVAARADRAGLALAAGAVITTVGEVTPACLVRRCVCRRPG